MSRPTKTGLDYSEWDVTVLSGDTDIDKLLESQGCAGFVIYFYLCQMAYSLKGYYYEWTFDDAASTAKRIGGGVRSETVIQAVNLCFRLGLFDKGLFDRYGILTSRRIQRGYLKVAERRVNCFIAEEYSLLQKNAEEGCAKHIPERNNRDRNAGFCDGNPGSRGRNGAKSRVEYSKEEYSKEEGARAREKAGPDWDEVRAFAVGRGWTEGQARYFFDVYAADDWCDTNGKRIRSWKQKLIYWEKDGRNVAAKAPTENVKPVSDKEKLEAMRRMCQSLQTEKKNNGGQQP